MKPPTVRWFGNAAHFIGGSHCRFHMATQVGRYLVSTVGSELDFGGYNDAGAATAGHMVMVAKYVRLSNKGRTTPKRTLRRQRSPNREGR